MYHPLVNKISDKHKRAVALPALALATSSTDSFMVLNSPQLGQRPKPLGD